MKSLKYIFSLMLLTMSIQGYCQQMYDRYGSYEGKVDSGRFYDRSRSYIGYERDRKFYDRSGSYIGYTNISVTLLDNYNKTFKSVFKITNRGFVSGSDWQ